MLFVDADAGTENSITYFAEVDGGVSVNVIISVPPAVVGGVVPIVNVVVPDCDVILLDHVLNVAPDPKPPTLIQSVPFHINVWPAMADVINTSAISLPASDNVLNVGVNGPPVAGPANTVLLFCVLNVPVKVPVVVTGEPVTVNTDAGNARATDVTVPVPPVPNDDLENQADEAPAVDASIVTVAPVANVIGVPAAPPLIVAVAEFG